MTSHKNPKIFDFSMEAREILVSRSDKRNVPPPNRINGVIPISSLESKY